VLFASIKKRLKDKPVGMANAGKTIAA